MADEAQSASVLDAPSHAHIQDKGKQGENTDDDEWEYEYHENEVEEFYLTLDLSGVATASRPDKFRAERQMDEDAETLERDGIEENNKLQIMDIHGKNPIVSYGGKVFSCRWASALGTDLHFANVVDTFEMGIDPLRPGSTYDLVGAGSARLVATSVDLKKQGVRAETEEEGILTNGLSGRPGWDASSGKQSQIRFMNRLEAVKRKKSEMDRITLGPFRPNQTFSQRFRIAYTPTEEEGDTSMAVPSDMSPVESSVMQDKAIKTRPNAKRRVNRSERSLHGDITQMRIEFEQEMRKVPAPPKPYTRPDRSTHSSAAGPSNSSSMDIDVDPANESILASTEQSLPTETHETALETYVSSDTSLSSDDSISEDDSESDTDDDEDLFEDMLMADTS